MRVSVALLGLLIAACSADDVIGPPTAADAERIAPRLAVIAISIAVAGQGAGVLDNFLPCGRRGIINFHSASPQTRIATFNSCDLGDSVVVNGVAEVYWSGTRNQPLSGPTSVSLLGDLAVTTGSRRSLVREIAVTNVQFQDQFANPFRMRIDSLRIGMNEQQFRANNTHGARGIVDPMLSSNAIAATDVNSLNDGDMKRIAFDAGLALGWYMATNVRQVDPGPNVIQTQCGLTHVQWDAQQSRTFFRQEWHNCRLFGGLLMSGNFEMRMPGAFQPTTTLQVIADGTLVLSAGLPTTNLTRFEWSLTIADMPGMARFSGLLRSQTQQRRFSFDVYVDD